MQTLLKRGVQQKKGKILLKNGEFLCQAKPNYQRRFFFGLGDRDPVAPIFHYKDFKHVYRVPPPRV